MVQKLLINDMAKAVNNAIIFKSFLPSPTFLVYFGHISLFLLG